VNALDGHLHLRAVRTADGCTALSAQSFRAPFHLSKPNWDPQAEVLHAQVVNPTAGILEGDRLESSIAVDVGAALLVTTPSASRLFRMTEGGHATGRQHFAVAHDATLEVFPEPIVPHRGSTYFQETVIESAEGSTLLFIDQLMPGRLAHGEAWAWDRLVLGLTVRRGGELILRERFDQTGASLRLLAEFAGTGPGSCFANVVFLPPADEASPAWRAEIAALHRDGVWLGISRLRTIGWSLRIVSPDPIRLRDVLSELRAILRRSYPRLGCGLRRP
jgi:urease accessory protein